MKLLNFGSLNYDFVYNVHHMVQPGETISSQGMETFCGGKGLNQSIALARSGVSVYHAGMVGEDGSLLLHSCKENGVDTRFISTVDGKSGHAIIQLNEAGENCILLFTGANGENSEAHIDEVLHFFEEGDILLLQNEINLLSMIIDKAFAKGMKIILNPSPYNEKIDRCDLSKISLFLVNEVEGWQITAEKDPESILQTMEQMFPNAEVVLTLGAGGCMYRGHGETYQKEGYKVDVVDTTAAGDTFTGYFISSIMENNSVLLSLKIATKAAALAVMKKGAATSIPGKDQLELADFW